MKTCSHCHTKKHKSQFGSNRSTKDKLNYLCKTCAKEYYKQRYQKILKDPKLLKKFKEYHTNYVMCRYRMDPKFKKRRNRYDAMLKRKLRENPEYREQYNNYHRQYNTKRYKEDLIFRKTRLMSNQQWRVNHKNYNKKYYKKHYNSRIKMKLAVKKYINNLIKNRG